MTVEPQQLTTAKRPLGRVRRLVVKVGSAVIAENGRLLPRVIADLAHDVTVLRHQGREIVMVVSGAVAAGYGLIGMDRPPTAVVERQAAASVGQHRLMAFFARAFSRHRLHVAQLLMTADDIEDRRRFLSARHTLNTLLARGVVPIINENDALSDDEAKVGDNDHLAAMVSSVASAQLLVILSRVDGVYADGNGHVIPRVEVGSSVDRHITADLTDTGVGGMAAKVSAAHLASHWGVPTIIAGGRALGQLQQICAGDDVGTLFMPREHKLPMRKRWIAFRNRSHGVLRVDEGARRAVVETGASLLPSGVRSVQGDFPMGSRVDVQDEAGATFAVGLVSYSAAEIRRLRGRRQQEIKDVLGYEYVKEIIDRDDMVVLG